MKGYYFSFSDIHKLVKKSFLEIQASQFKPDYILAIGAGGFIPARLLRTFIKIPIIAITTSSYCDKEKSKISTLKKEQWLEGVNIKNKKILVVDDIDDTRATLQFCLEEIQKENPAEIGLFILHNKLREKEGKYPEHIKKIFIGENLNDEWIHYPWESEDIDQFDELCINKKAQ